MLPEINLESKGIPVTYCPTGCNKISLSDKYTVDLDMYKKGG